MYVLAEHMGAHTGSSIYSMPFSLQRGRRENKIGGKGGEEREEKTVRHQEGNPS